MSEEMKNCPLAKAGILANPKMWDVVTSEEDTPDHVLSMISIWIGCNDECHLWHEADEYHAEAGCTLKTLYKGED